MRSKTSNSENGSARSFSSFFVDEKIPQIIQKESWFPYELRLFINDVCNFRCSFPKTQKFWCHSLDHSSSRSQCFANLEDMLRLARCFRDQLKIKKVKIAGMEPALHKHLENFVSGLKDLGFDDISLTSNGNRLLELIPKLVNSELQRVTFSLHTLNAKVFRQISRFGKLDRTLLAIESALDNGLVVSINRVLLKGVNDELGDVIAFCEANQIDLKLYELLWSPSIDEVLFEMYHINPWQVLKDHVLRDDFDFQIETEIVQRFSLSQRIRYTFKTNRGFRVKIDKFLPKISPSIPLCQKCSLLDKCKEGFLGYGFEITPDLFLTPCYLQPNLRIPINFNNIKTWLFDLFSLTNFCSLSHKESLSIQQEE